MIAAIVIGILVIILFSIYRKDYGRRLDERQKEVDKSNKELALLLQQSHMQLWTYNIATGTYSWLVEERAVFLNLQPKDFASHYSPKIFAHINQAIQELIRGEVEKKTLHVALKMKDNSKRYFALDMSVLRRDAQGTASVIVTFQNDITEIYIRESKDKEMRMRYESIFNSAMTDMVYYDAQGHICDMNKRACETFGIDLATAKQMGISVEMAVNEPGFDHHNFDTFHATQVRPSTLAQTNVRSEKLRGKMCYEIQVTPVYDARHRMVCAYGSGLNVTEIADAYYVMQENVRKTQQANEALTNYVRNIDFAMKVGGVRIVEYDPITKVLMIYKETNHVQIALTAERAMRYVDSTSQNIVQHMFERMDNYTTNPFNHQIKTNIRQPHNLKLHLYVYFMPVYDDQRNVVSYFGMVRDFTEAKFIERELANETIHARQEETQKNIFMHSMSHEIRTLLNNVVGFTDLFQQEQTAENEAFFISEIKNNAEQLLDLVNGILLLSRLNAGTVESKRQPTDIARILPAWCNAGYNEFRHDGVEYLVEHPDSPVPSRLNVDATNLGFVITQLCRNGAQLTPKGIVRTYYSYADGRLAISVESHGKGISEQQFEYIFDDFGSTMELSGVSLPICHRLMQLMGGTIDIQSDYGHQTTITVTLPCS